MSRRRLLLAIACAAVCLMTPAASGTVRSQVQPAAVFGAGGSGGINRAEHRDKPYVILVSFDGFHPGYLDRFDLPNFRRAAARGTRARAMMPVFPSLTFPNHYSLVTGLYAERHGIVANGFYDPERQAAYSFRDAKTVTDGTWYRGEPIWVTAETQGMVSACFFWPGSEAAIKGVRPTFWNTYDDGIPDEQRVRTVLDWLRLPPERRPHVMTLYFARLDVTSHRHALDAAAIGDAARSLDRTLGLLLDGLDALPIGDRVHVLLTSDHGMVDTPAGQILPLSSVVDTAGLRVGYSGAVTGLHIEQREGAAARAADLRDRINARLKHGRAYVRSELPERYHYAADPRAGDVVIVMDESWMLAHTSLAALLPGRWGRHGWDPALPSMHALFVLTGPGIPRGKVIPTVDAVDVYPLMTELLGLRAAPGLDGQAGRIRELLHAR